MRLIDADDFANHLGRMAKTAYPNLLPGLLEASDFARDFVTVDATPVVYGRWEQARYTEEPLYICSECNKPEYKKHRYCPNCGAKMDGDSHG